ncbi:hypothetical protein Peur_065983 [Populus x canadensis]
MASWESLVNEGGPNQGTAILNNCSALIWALFVPVTAMLGEGNAAANVTAATVRNERDAAIFVRDHQNLPRACLDTNATIRFKGVFPLSSFTAMRASPTQLLKVNCGYFSFFPLISATPT